MTDIEAKATRRAARMLRHRADQLRKMASELADIAADIEQAEHVDPGDEHT